MMKELATLLSLMLVIQANANDLGAEANSLADGGALVAEENVTLDKDNLGIMAEYSKLLEKQNNKSENFVTVGGEKVCDYQQISDALSAGVTEIRIANTGSPYKENLLIHDMSIRLSGGFSTCDMAWGGLKDDVNAVIDGDQDGETVIQVTGLGANEAKQREIVFRNIDITNGASVTKGGGFHFDSSASVLVTFEDVVIKDNFSMKGGGGIYIQGNNNHKLYFKNTHFANNTSMEDGGGVYCKGNASIFFNGGNTISGSEAFESGGGMFLRDCKMVAFSPFVMNNNKSYQNGGAIASKGGTQIDLYGFEVCNAGQCWGSNDKPISLWGNSAISLGDFYKAKGGAIFLGDSSKANLKNSVVSYNQADLGGAVAVESNSAFTTTGLNPKDCWSNLHCNWFSHNVAEEGGVFYLRYGARLTSERTAFMYNSADKGVIARLRGGQVTQADVLFESVLIAKNGVFNDEVYEHSNLFDTTGNVILDVLFTTIADNKVKKSVFLDEGQEFYLSASIIDEDVTIYSGANTDPVFYCLLVSEDKSVSNGVAVQKGNALFKDANASDHH
jgi:predicted outer membrane repeat protein